MTSSKITRTDIRALERLPAVKARTGLSRSEIYRRVALGTFPQPIKLGERLCTWSAQEVDEWIDACIHARDVATVRRGAP